MPTGSPVVDVFGSLPTPERIALEIRSWGSDAGYRQMFAQRWSTLLGLPGAEIDRVAGLGPEGFLERAAEILRPVLPSLEESLSLIREAGIVRTVIHGPLIADVPVSNDATAELVGAAPDLLVGFARIDPTAGAEAAAEVARCARLGLRGITITPFWHGLSCSDEVVTPVLRAAEEHGMVAWIHTSLNWRRTAPLELEHPRHIDVVAGRHPNLAIVCGHGGWPWVREMVAVCWRHPNVYIDVSAFRPKHVFVPNSGWEPLAYYGSRTIADRVLFGSTWTLLGVTPSQAVREAWEVPWPDQVKRAWLHDNGMRLLGSA